MEKFDKALAKVGGYKRFQILAAAFLSFTYYGSAFVQSYSIVFTGWEPPHKCKQPSNDKITNQTLQQNFMCSGNKTQFCSESSWNQTEFDFKCYTYLITSEFNSTSHEKVNCEEGWEFEGGGFKTMVQEWELVCDKNFYIEVAQSAFQFTSMIGEASLGFLADRFGRKKCHLASSLVATALGMGCAFSNGYILFVIFRVILGSSLTLLSTSAVALAFEMFDTKHRALPIISVQGMSFFCMFFLGVLAYSIRYWRHLQIAITLIIPLNALIVFFFIPESAAWLATKGKVKEAEEVLRKMARLNGIKLAPNTKLLMRIPPASSKELPLEGNVATISVSNVPLDFEPVTIDSGERQVTSFKEETHSTPVYPPLSLPSSHETHLNISDSFSSKTGVHYKRKSRLSSIFEEKIKLIIQPKIKDLFTDKVMLKFLLISCLNQFTITFLFSGIMLSSASIGFHRFINFIILNCLEIPGLIMGICFGNRIGRKVIICSNLLIICILLAISILLPDTINGAEMRYVKMAAIWLVAVFMMFAFCIIMVYFKELFPTNLRGTSIGILMLWSRMGSFISPSLSYMIKTNRSWVAYLVYIIVCLLACLSVTRLPETLGQPLPNTLEECYKLNEKKINKK